MSDATERRLGEMCNLSEVLIESGDKQGFERGDKQGFKRGELSGKITARFEDGMSIEQIAEKTKVSIDFVKETLKDSRLI